MVIKTVFIAIAGFITDSFRAKLKLKIKSQEQSIRNGQRQNDNRCHLRYKI